MNPDTQHRYEFQPGLPIPGVAPGTNLLVSGPSGSGVRDIALDMIVAGPSAEATLLVSGDVDAGGMFSRLEDVPEPYDRSLLGIVDCSGDPGEDDPRFGAHAEPIADPGDLTSIEIEFSILYEKLAERDPSGIRIGLFSLSTMLDHAPLTDVSRFLHMLTGRIIATDDLGVFVVDSSSVDRRTLETLDQFCDGHVEVRVVGREGRGEEGATEIRVSGLDDYPQSWSPVEYDVPTETWEKMSAEPE